MTDSASATPLPSGSRLRGSTSDHTHYISADENASQTEVGDTEESSPKPVEVIDLVGDENPDSIDLTGDDDGQRYSSRNLEVDFSEHDSATSARTLIGETVETGDCVECTHGDRDRIAFLRVVKITRSHGEIYLHGDLLQRTGDVDERFPKAGGEFALHSLMPRKKNEVCAVLQVAKAITTSLGVAIVTKHISEVGKVRNVIFTNKARENLNGQSLGEFFHKDEWKQMEATGTLFCRRKYIEEMDTKRKTIGSYQIRWIDEQECNPDCGIPAVQIFDSGRPVLHTPESPKRKQEVINISSDDDDEEPIRRGLGKQKKRSLRERTQSVQLENDHGDKELFIYKVTEKQAGKKYIYADLCAGAGGTTTGAKMAGLQLRYLLDFDKDACKTLELNFGGVAILKMDISAFSESDTTGVTGGDPMDVMHISFPCQGHSAANTGVNPELDSVRIATAYGTLESILKKCKPRILTLEQVPGILWKKDGQHFRAQVCALAQAGYSLRWKVVNFAQYGNSQARKRVIVIAACPGQILPPFPTPTHGEGLKAFVTVADVLSGVPRLPPNDPMAHTLARDPRKFPPWNPNLPLRCCITGDGGLGNWHPSGLRTFSFQEKSQLQGFPANHRYYSSTRQSLGKQIGNAVPPVFAKALFEAVIPCLEEMDEKVRKWKLEEQRKKDFAAKHPIVLD